MKAIANTTLSLGLINLPIGICKASGELDDVKFNLGDAQGRQLKQQYVDPEGNVVASADQTKTINGHIIDPEALKAIADATKLDALVISKIEDRSRFDAEAYRITGSYFIQSTKKTGNVNAFRLFVDALAQMNQVAVTKVCFRTRQQLFVIYPDADGNLRGATLAFAEDARTADDNVKAHSDGSYSEDEMEMAKALLTALAAKNTDPLSTETDAAISQRKALVQQYMDGKALPVIVTTEQPEKNAALADALQASLDAIKAAV